MNHALWQRGALALATAIRTREVSSREVLEAHLARVAEVNPHVQAITEVLAEPARAAADAAVLRLCNEESHQEWKWAQKENYSRMKIPLRGDPSAAGSPRAGSGWRREKCAAPNAQ